MEAASLTGKHKGNKAIAYWVTAVYALIVLFVVPFHEPWRDEAQVWLLGRDCSFIELFRELSYDGSPALWHLIVMALVKSGLPYVSMGYAHALIAILAVYILLRYAPFPLTFKILFAFSYLMVFEYALIARSYGLSVLLIFSLAALWEKKRKIPLIYGSLLALLVNTNTHSIMPAAAFGLLFILGLLQRGNQQKAVARDYLAILIMVTGAVISFLTVFPPADSWKPGFADEHAWLAPIDGLTQAFIPTFLSNSGMTLFFKHWSAYFFFSFFMLPAFFYLRKSPSALLFLIVSAAGLSYILIFKHSGYIRHYGFYMIYLVAALWLRESKDFKGGSRAEFEFWTSSPPLKSMIYGFLCLCFATSVITGAWSLYMDVRYAFSGSKEMANYIKENKLNTQILSAYNHHANISLYPYLPGTSFWDPGLMKSFTYIHWDKNYLPSRELEENEMIQRSLQKAGTRSDFFLLLNRPLEQPAIHGFILSHKVDEKITSDEYYYLYRHQP